MEAPLVSIITPSFNQGRYLEETIQTVLNQTYRRIEYIIIDGASTDDSVAIIKKYDRRLAYWCSEPDNGQTEAINKGLRQARGQIVCWLNSDDLYFPDTIATAVSAFQFSDSDVVYGDYTLVTETGVPFLQRKEIPFNYNLLKYGVNFIGQPSSFFRRDMLERYGYLDTSLRYAMDLDFWLRIASRGAKFKHVKKFLSLYRYHPTSKTVGDADRFGLEMMKVRQRYCDGKSPAIIKSLGFAARIQRQLVKMCYRGTMDYWGGPLSRWKYRLASAHS